MIPTYHVGQRVSFDSFICTVRYIGPVEGAGTDKQWLGVEWDDPRRGKHDGKHNGIKYFDSMSDAGRSRSSRAASFVSIQKASDVEQSFIEAVHQKYATDISSQNHISLDARIEISGKVVEKVGFDKIRQLQSQLQELKIVIVDGFRINDASSDENIQEHCRNIVELDLSRNLFESLKGITRICGELHALQRLRLNGNRLTIKPGELRGNLTTEFVGVQELEIDDTLLDWQSICAFALPFINLKKLSASSNGLYGDQLQSLLIAPDLTSLALEYNEFTTLEELRVLAGIPFLKSLLLKGNKIFKIGPYPPVFGLALEYVDLSYNMIAKWSFVDKLSVVFPSMRSLRISQNPLYPSLGTNLQDVDETFFITIARISGLRTLNFSNITAQDRTNAEMFYLSRIGQELASVSATQEDSVASTHKRFAELCALHGHPTVIRKTAVETDPNTLGARLIKFTLYLPGPTDRSPGEEARMPTVKLIEIPETFDTYRLKGIVGRRFHLRPLNLKLIWETGAFDPVAGYEDAEIEIDDEDMDIPLTRALKEEDKFTRREVELIEGTRPICNTIEGKEATVRIELKQPPQTLQYDQRQ